LQLKGFCLTFTGDCSVFWPFLPSVMFLKNEYLSLSSASVSIFLTGEDFVVRGVVVTAFLTDGVI
jgi:hypothetical protein